MDDGRDGRAGGGELRRAALPLRPDGLYTLFRAADAEERVTAHAAHCTVLPIDLPSRSRRVEPPAVDGGWRVYEAKGSA